MTTCAGIDCGTNSTRLLVADDEGRTLERLMRITRLGQGVDATGRLADEAVGRTVAVLEEYREVLDRHGVERVRMTATSAARDAANRDDFFAAAEAAVGSPPELISGDEEAALSVVEAHLDDVILAVPEVLTASRLVGLAGTITTVAAVELGLPAYDTDAIHHFELTHEAAEDVFRTLATETVEQRKANPGLEPERADVIVGGTLILVKVMRQLGFDRCLVSEADILDGLARSLR